MFHSHIHIEKKNTNPGFKAPNFQQSPIFFCLCLCQFFSKPLIFMASILSGILFQASLKYNCTNYKKAQICMLISQAFKSCQQLAFFTCTPHVQNMYTTCIPNVHHMYASCTPYVHNMYTKCTPHVHSMYITCSPHLHHSYTTCSQNVLLKYTSCTPNVHLLHITCTPQVHHMYNTCLQHVFFFCHF